MRLNIIQVFRKKLHHKAEQLKSRSFWERFGKLSEVTKTGGIHVHCVSVGEVNAANGLSIGQTDITAIGLCAGDYVVFVTDQNNIIHKSDTVEISQPIVLGGSVSITSNYNGVILEALPAQPNAS